MKPTRSLCQNQGAEGSDVHVNFPRPLDKVECTFIWRLGRWREKEMRGLSDHDSVCMNGQFADIVICFQCREEQREPSIAGHVDTTLLVSLLFSQTLTQKVRHTRIHGNLSMRISWNPVIGFSCIWIDRVSETYI